MSSGVQSRARQPQVLSGIRVIELGQLIAGPFCGKILGEFDAEVIKVEPPGLGDPLRKWRLLKDGTSVWWQVQSRNKRSVTRDLRQAEGQDVCRKLIAGADVLLENFRPGTLEKWGLGWDRLSRINPGLIMLRISGYGQDGPRRDMPGFAAIGEAMGGMRYLIGEPGRVPVRTGVSMGDTLAALHGAIGVLLALYYRTMSGGKGQVIDVALYEAVFNCMESLLPEYSAFGVVREPAGSTLPGIAPSNAYSCNDGYVLIAGNGDSIFKRLMETIGCPDLARDRSLQSNEGRVARAEEPDAAIGAWTTGRSVNEALNQLDKMRVPAGRIYTAEDIAKDTHYRARDMIHKITTHQGYELEVPGIVPKLSLTPGAINTPAPPPGDDTESVLGELVGADDFANLRTKKII
jgi:formyl-CoA transferase